MFNDGGPATDSSQGVGSIIEVIKADFGVTIFSSTVNTADKGVDKALCLVVGDWLAAQLPVLIDGKLSAAVIVDRVIHLDKISITRKGVSFGYLDA